MPGQLQQLDSCSPRRARLRSTRPAFITSAMSRPFAYLLAFALMLTAATMPPSGAMAADTHAPSTTTVVAMADDCATGHEKRQAPAPNCCVVGCPLGIADAPGPLAPEAFPPLPAAMAAAHPFVAYVGEVATPPPRSL